MTARTRQEGKKWKQNVKLMQYNTNVQYRESINPNIDVWNFHLTGKFIVKQIKEKNAKLQESNISEKHKWSYRH